MASSSVQTIEMSDVSRVVHTHPKPESPDIEASTLRDNDPLDLSARVKSSDDISSLRTELRRRNQANSARSSFRASLFAFRRKDDLGQAPVSAISSTSSSSTTPVSPVPDRYKRREIDVKGVQEFYEAQNELIDRLLKTVDEHRSDAKQERGSTRLKYILAVQGSFAANVVLSGLQLYAAISSGSLSLFASKWAKSAQIPWEEDCGFDN